MVARVPTLPRARWVPDRQDVIWIDCNPQVGAEMRDVHPLLVLSPRAFNDRTNLVIGLPMTSARYNATNPFAVVAGSVGKGRASKVSYVLCHQPQSFDWRLRGGKAHPSKRVSSDVMDEVCERLNQIICLR